MKRFTVFTALLSVSILAVWAFAHATPPKLPSTSPVNALETQHAQPGLDTQNKPVVVYSHALELQYAQPWLEKAHQLIAISGNAENKYECNSNLEMLYACKYGYGLP